MQRLMARESIYIKRFKEVEYMKNVDVSLEILTKVGTMKNLTLQSSTFLNEEILNQCFEYLTQRDLIAVIQTCKFWGFVLTPRLYKRIMINGSPCQNDNDRDSLVKRYYYQVNRKSYPLTRLKFDNEKEKGFDKWLNFKIPINNLIKLYTTLVGKPELCCFIEEIEIFDCYKAELRFYIIQILELILSNNQLHFRNFRCHHSTSNQFYYQCSCYQDFFEKLLNYSRRSLALEKINSEISNYTPPVHKLKNLCLNFNDFVRYFVSGSCQEQKMLFTKFENFEIIINSHELDINQYRRLNSSMGNDLNVSNFFNQVTKLTINDNFEYFASFMMSLIQVSNNQNGRKVTQMCKLRELTVKISYVTDEVLAFFNRITKLTKLTLNLFDSSEFEVDHTTSALEELIPWKLFNILSQKFKYQLTQLSIRLNNKDELFPFILDNFPRLTHLSILNKFNSQRELSIFHKLKDLKYFNFNFQINSRWLRDHHNLECGCDEWNSKDGEDGQMREKYINIFIYEILSLITPKHDYRYLDQDLDLDGYPIGTITPDYIAKINKEYKISMSMDNIEDILKYLVHVITNHLKNQQRFAKFENLRYISIGGVPFFLDASNNVQCLIRQ